MIRSSLRAVLAAAAACALLAPVSAQSQTDLVDPTDWQFRSLNSLSSVNSLLQSGYRMVDVEPEPLFGSLFFGGTFVRNAGAYGKGWWWYFDQTEAQVTSRLSQHSARLIDVEPYETSSGVRYAIVLIPNSGEDFAVFHGWETDMTFSQVSSWLSSFPSRRITDIQPYTRNGSQRYSFTWVLNTGTQESNWWLQMNTTPSVIASTLNQNNARIVDLEPHDGTGRMTALMVPNDGNAWLWFYGVNSSVELQRLADQHACRMIDSERYLDGGGSLRYAAVMRRNANDATIDANFAMRDRLPLDASSGLMMREIGAGSVEIADVFGTKVFEPASLMKTVHHYVACKRVEEGADSFSSQVTENLGLNGSCPTGSDPIMRPLRSVLRSMMVQSSNTATEAIRARYGTGFIEGRAAAVGATEVALNHTIGCLCGLPRNEIRLEDLAAIHDAVADGALGDVREDFYELMVNGSNFAMGAFSTMTVLDQELAASSLSNEAEAAFRAGLRFAFKGGGYTCITSANREEHRCRAGYLRLPFRSGCGTDFREYFVGAWVNDAVTEDSAEDAAGAGLATMFRERLRAAIDSWESSSCTPFSSYCTAVPNSTGSIGRTVGAGSPYVLTNDFAVEGYNLPPNQFGLLIYSTTTSFITGVGGGEGNLCIGSPLVRFNAPLQASSASGFVRYPVDLNVLAGPSGSPGVEPGETLYFQFWHRDASPVGPPTSNLTQGLRATFI